MNTDDLLGDRRFRALNAFGAILAANLLFTFALAGRLEGSGIAAFAVFPGVTRTNLMHNGPAPFLLFSGAFTPSPS
jgi:NAD(P)-dependent dehydrogenase (short-subunit alcohol dehydrogenase family)